MDVNFIVIYDNSAKATVKFVSESVSEVLGFTAEELIGTCGYELTHPDERDALTLVHGNNVRKERLSTITTYRSRHKDGYYVPMDITTHYCFDTLICTNFAVTSPVSLKRKLRLASADITYEILPDGTLCMNGSKEDATEVLREKLTRDKPWGDNEKVQLSQEPRFCMILNRYTAKATIVFATRLCQTVISLDPYDCIGKSIYEYISPKDKESVKKQIELSKQKEFIQRLRFDWIVDENKLTPIEAVISCTDDGIVFVGRSLPSFTNNNHIMS